MITEILRPGSVQEALKARGLPGAAFLGGGTWLNARPSEDPVILVSLEKLGLATIEASGTVCSLGAMVTFQQLVDHPGVPGALRRAAALTASRTLRNMVTVGGELAIHPADSALIPMLLAMGADVSLAGRRKPLPLPEYLQNIGSSLVLSISVRNPLRPGSVRCLSRTSHGGRSLVIAVIADAVAPRLSGLKIAATDCRAGAARLLRAEEALEGRPVPAAADIESQISRWYEPQPDPYASAPYKLLMAGVLLADVLKEMAQSPEGT